MAREMHIMLGDSIVNNVLWAVQQKHGLQLKFQVKAESVAYTVVMMQDASIPMLTFNVTENNVRFSGAMTASLAASGEPAFNTTFVFKAGIELDIIPAKQPSKSSYDLMIKAGADYGFEHIGQGCDSPCSLVLSAISTHFGELVIILNEFLSSNPIGIPMPKNINITELSLNSTLGHIDIAAQVKPDLASPDLHHDHADVAETFVGHVMDTQIQCPNIPKAHQDGCI
jgi:hypothetical protein